MGHVAALLVTLGVLSGVVPAQAQIYASEPATVSQTIAGTVITIAYSRPSVRGRDSIFGKHVTWGEMWTPGANQATTLSVTKPVGLNGLEVPAGKYSVWIEVLPDTGWTLYLHPDTTLFHIPHPSADEMVYAVPVTRQLTHELRETLTFDFERVRARGAELQLRWAETLVSVDVTVEFDIETRVDAVTGRAFEGTWAVTMDVADTTTPEPSTMQVRYNEDTQQLLGELQDGPGGDDWEFVLVPRAEGIFLLGMLMDGELVEVNLDYFLEFTVENSRAVSFVGRDKDDVVFWRGERAGG